MDTDILDRALDSCDLGDGYKALVRMYPHKDMIPKLTRVREVREIDWGRIWLALNYKFDLEISNEASDYLVQLVEKQLKGEE